MRTFIVYEKSHLKKAKKEMIYLKAFGDYK